MWLLGTGLFATALALADSPAVPFSAWYSNTATGLAAPQWTLAADESVATQPTLEQPPPAAEQESDPKPSWLDPVSFSITYSLYSDYVARAVNLSEYRYEGREKPNHQLSTSLDLDVARFFGRDAGEFGAFGFDTFFEWYAGEGILDPVYGAHNCQEIDYTLRYSYEIAPLHTTLTAGYIFVIYPNHKEITTQELYLRVEHNDGWIWNGLLPDTESGVLNPYLALWLDTEFIPGSAWWQFGFSHDFELAPSLTLTPTVDFGVDHRWLAPVLLTGYDGTRGLANIQYGLTISYDMTDLIKLNEWGFGSVVWSGFLFYSDAVGNPRDDHLTADEFYGGTSIGWSF